MQDLTGREFGAYRILERVGEGGMSVIYKAYQTNTDRHVALKVLPPYYAADPIFLGRFEQEARTLAKLNHAHILPLFDFGQVDDFTYIVMPFVESGTLTDLTDKGQPLPLDKIERIISQVGSALDYAHSYNLVHRDIKPDNILIDEHGNCRLTDFGVVKVTRSEPNRFTKTGVTMGTPAYMSPEQVRGKELDKRSDIYALGVILYQMMTGQLPYEADTTAEVMVKHLHEPLPPPREINPDLPEPVEQVIIKALAKQAKDRYNSAGELVEALQSAISSQAAFSQSASPAPPPVDPNESGATDPKISPLLLEQENETQPQKQSGSTLFYVRLGCVAVALVVICIGAGAFFVFRRTPPSTIALVTETATDEATPVASATPTELPATPTDTPVSDILPPPATATNEQLTATSRPTTTATATSTSTPEPVLGFARDNRINVRSGPGTNYDIITVLERSGDQVEILRRTSAADWLEVKTLSAEIGWTAASLIATQSDIQTVDVALSVPPTPTANPNPPTSNTVTSLTLDGQAAQGSLAANGDKWFSFFTGERDQASIIAFISGGDKVELYIYLQSQDVLVDGKIPPNPDDALRNKHVALIAHEGGENRDPDRNERIFDGAGLVRNSQYFVRLANRGSDPVQYCLAPKDVFSCP